LARYIAASASRISSSALTLRSALEAATATPMLALTKCSTPSIEKGWAKAAATRSAIAIASAGVALFAPPFSVRLLILSATLLGGALAYRQFIADLFMSGRDLIFGMPS